MIEQGIGMKVVAMKVVAMSNKKWMCKKSSHKGANVMIICVGFRRECIEFWKDCIAFQICNS